MPEKIETVNSQLVGVQGNKIIVGYPQREMTKEEALRHAAWIVMCADHGDLTRFTQIFAAIKAV